MERKSPKWSKSAGFDGMGISAGEMKINWGESNVYDDKMQKGVWEELRIRWIVWVKKNGLSMKRQRLGVSGTKLWKRFQEMGKGIDKPKGDDTKDKKIMVPIIFYKTSDP